VKQVGQGAHVGSIEALERLSSQYQRFVRQLIEVLLEIEQRYSRYRAFLEQAVEQQRHRVEALRQQYHDYEGADPDSLWLRLQRAKEEFYRTQRALQQVDEEWKMYTSIAKRVRSLAEELEPKAVQFLKSLSGTLQAYVSVPPPGERDIVATTTIPNTQGESSASLKTSPTETTNQTPTTSKPCKRCGGEGRISRVSFHPERFEHWANPDHSEPCPDCNGKGFIEVVEVERGEPQ
jgi:hypothetical protein